MASSPLFEWSGGRDKARTVLGRRQRESGPRIRSSAQRGAPMARGRVVGRCPTAGTGRRCRVGASTLLREAGGVADRVEPCTTCRNSAGRVRPCQTTFPRRSNRAVTRDARPSRNEDSGRYAGWLSRFSTTAASSGGGSCAWNTALPRVFPAVTQPTIRRMVLIGPMDSMFAIRTGTPSVDAWTARMLSMAIETCP